MIRKRVLVTTVLALVFILPGCLSFFGLKEYGKKTKAYGFQDFTTYFLRDSPITVREYLIFLAWNIDVYGDSFPEYISGLFPVNCSDKVDTTGNDFNLLFDCAKFSFSRYVLTGMHIDYPISGLSTYQLKEIYKWLTDRYNENMLVDIGYLNFNPNQKDGDSYSLEADLCNLFQGDIENTDMRPSWMDGFYVPLFRPPHSGESFPSSQVVYKNKVSPVWREYKLTNDHFLYKWDQLYIYEDSEEIKLNTNIPIRIKKQSFNMRSKDRVNSFYLDEILTDFKRCTYFEEQEREEKNEYGRMSFYVLGETGLNRPIVIDSLIYRSEINPMNCIYWVAYNGRIDFKYWP